MMKFKNNLRISKLCFFIFLLYLDWYKEIWGDTRIILYSSVFLMTFFLYYDDRRIVLPNIQTVPKIIKIYIVFGIYSLIAGLIACSDKERLLSSLITYFEYILVLINCYTISSREKNCRWMSFPIIAVALICACQTVLNGVELQNGGATAIVMSESNNPNSLAGVFIFGIFALIISEFDKDNYTVVRMVMVIFLLYAIILTGSRKVLISSLFLVGIFLILMIKDSISRLRNYSSWMVLLAIIVLIVLIRWYYVNIYYGSDQYIRFMNMITNSDGVNDKRISLYNSAIEVWKTSPIFGVGFNQFSLHSGFETGYYTHSTYAEVLSCQGIIGCIILFMPIGLYFFEVIKTNLNAKKINGIYILSLVAFIIEFFLGIGQIWIYGFTHEFFFLYFTSLYESEKSIQVSKLQGAE